MSEQVMDEATFGPIREVLARSAADADLRQRLMDGPITAIAAETGIELPDEWNLVAALGDDGAVTLSFTGEEIPDFMLDSISGGVNYGFPPLWQPRNGIMG